MMALLGQWLGFTDDETSKSKSSSSSSSSSSRPSQPGIVISSPKKPSSSSSHSSQPSSSSSPSSTTTTPSQQQQQQQPLRKTKSDELLRDFEVMRFLCSVDERLKRQHLLLSHPQLERLQTLQAQALADDCPLLIDIIEHFEIEHDKLRHRLACAAPGSAAVDAARSRRNMLVF